MQVELRTRTMEPFKTMEPVRMNDHGKRLRPEEDNEIENPRGGKKRDVTEMTHPEVIAGSFSVPDDTSLSRLAARPLTLPPVAEGSLAIATLVPTRSSHSSEEELRVPISSTEGSHPIEREIAQLLVSMESQVPDAQPVRATQMMTPNPDGSAFFAQSMLVSSGSLIFSTYSGLPLPIYTRPVRPLEFGEPIETLVLKPMNQPTTIGRPATATSSRGGRPAKTTTSHSRVDKKNSDPWSKCEPTNPKELGEITLTRDCVGPEGSVLSSGTVMRVVCNHKKRLGYTPTHPLPSEDKIRDLYSALFPHCDTCDSSHVSAGIDCQSVKDECEEKTHCSFCDIFHFYTRGWNESVSMSYKHCLPANEIWAILPNGWSILIARFNSKTHRWDFRNIYTGLWSYIDKSRARKR